MRISSRLLLFCLMALCLPLRVRAEEKNGLQVSVQKVTLDRADVRGGDVNMENLDRLMALRVSIRNTSFKSMPEGEVTWEILRRKYDDSGIELTSGVEKLPHLKAGESTEVTWGIVKVLGYRNGAILRKDELEWELTFKVNIDAMFYLTKAAVPHMKPGSAIINTGSVTGIEGSKYLLDYSMTKGGIHAFTRSLSANLIPKGIRVNCVAPGPVWTPLNPADRQADDVAKFGQQSAMKRAAQPEEIAPAYVFLAAPSCSSYITGEILPIIGGYSGG